MNFLKGIDIDKVNENMKPVYRILNRFSLFFHGILSCMINVLIEVISRHSLTSVWVYMTGTPLVFLYNAAMIYLSFSIVFFFRRRQFARIMISGGWIILGLANGYMLSKRVTPFNAQDLKVAKDAVTMIRSYLKPWEILLVFLLVIAMIIWIVTMYKRGGQYEGRISKVRAAVFVLGCTLAFSALTKVSINQRVVSTYFGNIAFAYEDYGLPYCFMSSLFHTGIGKPYNYNSRTIQRISRDYQIRESRKEGASGVFPNIIFVQLESYFDVNEAEFFTTSRDASPNLRYMFKNFSTGYFKVPSIGAGTANTEFEVITGMNLRFFGPGEYPYKTVLKENTCESAATALKVLGYGTHAIHNNGGNFYSRSRVFNNIGFDDYTSKEFMNILRWTENGWAKDDILIPHIMEALDSTKRQDFVFCISVQGHGQYPEDKVIDNPEILVEGIEDEAKKNKWEYYVNQVHEMDRFAGDLIRALEERGEPTVVVFYGDHLPTLDLKVEDLRSRYLYNTNYVIWDNIGLKKEDRNIPSYQIMADVFDRVGIRSGTVFNYHQERRKTKDYLADLELLQYDLLYGSRYVYRGKPSIEKGHMLMGLKNVEINGIYEWLPGGFRMQGKNLTPNSRVFINGKKQKSTFINNESIILGESAVSDGDLLQVVQMGSNNTPFRKSKAYVYEEGKLRAVNGTGTYINKSWVDQMEEDDSEQQ